MAVPVAYRSSQARGQIGAAAEAYTTAMNNTGAIDEAYAVACSNAESLIH